MGIDDAETIEANLDIAVSSDVLSAFERVCGNDSSVEFVPAARVPEPFRFLLDHRRSMTAVLAARWTSEIRAAVRSQQISEDGAWLCRTVNLVAVRLQLSVEIAGIRIPRAALPAEVERQLRLTDRPYGAILTSCGVAFTTEPVGFVRCVTGATLAGLAGVPEGSTLFGRLARIWGEGRQFLGESLELLPRA